MREWPVEGSREPIWRRICNIYSLRSKEKRVSSSKEGTLRTIRCFRKTRDGGAAWYAEKAQASSNWKTLCSTSKSPQLPRWDSSKSLLKLLHSLRLSFLICQMEPTVARKERRQEVKNRELFSFKMLWFTGTPLSLCGQCILYKFPTEHHVTWKSSRLRQSAVVANGTDSNSQYRPIRSRLGGQWQGLTKALRK